MTSEPGRLRFVPPCDNSDARFERGNRHRGLHVRVEAIEGEVIRTVTTTAELSCDGAALIFSLKGTVLFKTDRESGWRVIAPQSVTFVETPVSATIRVAKGAHSVIAAYWARGSMPILENWLDARREGRSTLSRA